MQRSEFSLLELGFRPFFLLAGGGALLLMLIWLGHWHGEMTPESYYGRIGWHSHEMLFGYVVAVAAGFLLTAVRNWTGRATASGTGLALLAVLWLLGRTLCWIPATPDGLLATVDFAFLPALALSLRRPLWAGQNRINRRFFWLLLAMAAANGLVHAQSLGWLQSGADTGTLLMLDLTLLLLVWVSGRVVPFFTRVAVPGAVSPSRSWVESSWPPLVVALGISHQVPLPDWIPALLNLALFVLVSIRLIDWHHPGIWSIPILWILFCGLAWLCVALLMSASAELGAFPQSAARHALTVGAFGIFTLGMMARVALGHTGRPMRAHWQIVTGFVMLSLAALIRVFGPWLAPASYVAWVMLAGLLWILSFGLFVWIYTPILIGPRRDPD